MKAAVRSETKGVILGMALSKWAKLSKVQCGCVKVIKNIIEPH